MAGRPPAPPTMATPNPPSRMPRQGVAYVRCRSSAVLPGRITLEPLRATDKIRSEIGIDWQTTKGRRPTLGGDAVTSTLIMGNHHSGLLISPTNDEAIRGGVGSPKTNLGVTRRRMRRIVRVGLLSYRNGAFNACLLHHFLAKTAHSEQRHVSVELVQNVHTGNSVPLLGKWVLLAC
jgi:hypothetical protein